MSLVFPRLPLYLASLFISLVFLLVNLTCAVLVKTGDWDRKVIVSVRVAINDTLFVLCAISLSICLYKISKMSLANIYLESKVKVGVRSRFLMKMASWFAHWTQQILLILVHSIL